jgi:hypothetical protein
VSFAALPVENGRYLIDTGPSFHYLAAERDLVDLDLDPPAGNDLLALGDPDFDHDAVERAGPAAPAGRVPPAAEPAFRGARSSCGEFTTLRFTPLHAAGQEVERIADLWRAQGRPFIRMSGHEPETRDGGTDADARGTPSALVLSGTEANERAFKENAPGKRIVHLATHAFFLGDACAPATTRPGGDSVSRRPPGGLPPDDGPPPAGGDSPLLLSGIALAGANSRADAPPGEEDGILTAEEIAALHLEGTEWAVLSACNTGSGVIQPGEGVLGLRRAFQTAGARTVIMSLWPVDDRATSAWMSALYDEHLVQKRTTLDATRAATGRVLRDRREKGLSTHPYFWAGFVAAGDWK